MTKTLRIIALLICACPLPDTAADENPNDLVQMGAYVASNNMSASEEFYSALLGLEPVIKLDNFIAFNVAGGILAIANREVYSPDSSPGTGAVPYIHSTDLRAVQARLEQVSGKEAPGIIVEPGIHILKVVDPEGQLIEFFTLIK